MHLFVFNSSRRGGRTGTSLFLCHALYAVLSPCALQIVTSLPSLPPLFSFLFLLLLLSRFSMYSCFVHLLYLDRLSWANVIKWKGSLRSPSLFTPDLIVVVLSIYIRRELNKQKVQLPEDWFRTPTWPPFYYFRTPIR